MQVGDSRAREQSMTLRRTMGLIIIGTTLGLTATMFLVSRVLVSRGFEDVERDSAQRDIERAMNAVDVAVSQITTTTTDWAAWDATYERGVTGDPGYVSENLAGGTVGELGLNWFLLLDREGRVVIGWTAEGEDSAAAESLTAELLPYLDLAVAESSGFAEFGVSGIARTSVGPLLFYAQSVLPSNGEGPSRGVLIMAKYLDDQTVAELGVQTVLDLSVTAWEAGAEGGLTLQRPVRIEASGSDTIVATGLVRDAKGEPAFVIRADLPRDIARTGAWVSASMLAGVIATALVFGSVVFVLLERTVVRRLRVLGQAASTIGMQGALHGRVPADGSDEVAQLARDINSMLELLERSDERYERLVHSAVDAILVLKDGRIAFANPAASALFATEQAESVTLEAMLPEADRDALGEVMANVRESDQPGHLDTTVTRPDGTVRRVEFTFGRTAFEGITAVQVIARDTTERHEAEQKRKALEARLLETQRLESLGLLAGGIAHDFNNLMMAVLGSSEVVRLSSERHPGRDEALDDIELAARRAADLTGQLLAYAGKGRLLLTAVDANRLATETAALMRHVGKRTTSIELELDANAPAIEGDATQLRQVVLNLVANALDAVGDDGQVRIRTGIAQCRATDLVSTAGSGDFADGDYVFVEVEDNGPGISNDVRKRMFEPFYSTKGTGRGLGLAAVLGIVQSHGGAITIHCEPGQGTTIRVFFRPSQQPALVAEPADSEPDRSALDVLIVDDDPTVRRVARAMFESRGDSVTTAASGFEALDVLGDGLRSDLVMLDVTMPGMNGYELLRRIRETHPRLPIVVATGHSAEDMPHAVAADPGVRFLQKPFDLRTLGGVVSELIEAAPG